MLLMHQVLPHVHHEHVEIKEGVTKTDEHHHSDGNDHHHEKDKEDKGFDFLGFLFGNHTHSIDIDTFPAVKNIIIQKTVNKSFTLEAIPVFQIHSSFNDNRKQYKLGHTTPDIGKRFYLYTSALRGPPLLG